MRVRVGLAALLLGGCLLMAGLQEAHATAAEATQPETTTARVLKVTGAYMPEQANPYSRGCHAKNGCRG
ncbi:hypothetical protein CFC21_040130 [Triticum aestivum]|uniref:Uncharacterized protein n=3 Tax=Triticum TaxID=4564 RepID=A0A9R1JSL4_WHEAT|nr:hypothetical protein CFC21_040130 [Triticum aestivum]CDM81550.1 unnamed protein product [Triticum aestivum]VAH73274.1 unnamed protein product [Triticum turgidum subsp. durum]